MRYRLPTTTQNELKMYDFFFSSISSMIYRGITVGRTYRCGVRKYTARHGVPMLLSFVCRYVYVPENSSNFYFRKKKKTNNFLQRTRERIIKLWSGTGTRYYNIITKPVQNHR